jgi:preprotein translocase subunit SecA
MSIVNVAQDYYQILGVKPGISVLEIKKAYFSMVRKYPPERFPEDFMKIRAAYEVLSNEKTRSEYDSIAELPAFVRSNLEYARQALAADDIKVALEILEELVEKFPGVTFMEGLLGEAYLENGNSGKAIKIFEGLLRGNPQNAGFNGHLAHAYLMRGWHKKAIGVFKRALKLDEDNLSLWTGLAEAFSRADKYKEARKVLLEALRKGKDKDWDHAGLYLSLVSLDIILGDLEGMETHLEELTGLVAEQEDIRESVGWALEQIARFMASKGLMETAKAVVARAHRLLPEDGEIEKLKEDLEHFERLEEQLTKLKQDDIHEDLISLLDLSLIHKTGSLDSKLLKANIFLNELTIIEQFPRYNLSLKRLKKYYPDLYAVRADFFNKVMNPRRRRKMLDQYLKEFPRYGALLEALSGWGEDGDDDGFLDEDGQYDDEIDFFDEDDEPFAWTEPQPQQPYVREEPKIGRNEPCPCGSGKKYKKCCGR